MFLIVFAWAVVAVTSAWAAAGLIALRLATRRRIQCVERPAPVSVLKPLCGMDSDLEANLESFFRQDHPEIELVFGAVDADDPALGLVRKLRERYPQVSCQIVVHPGAQALNPKVDNLSGLMPRARYDLVLVSDSNVRAPPHYVRELATLLEREHAGLATNLFAGTGERSFGAALESVELTGFTAAGVALPTLLGDALLIGKSALFSRSRFEELGGLERLSDLLAEDFVMGKTFARAGDRIVVSSTVLENVTGKMTLKQTFKRRLRWSMLRFRLRPLAAVLEPLTYPLAVLPLASVVMGFWAALAWMSVLLLLRDSGGWLILRGKKRLWIPVLLAPFRDALALLVWFIAPLKHHVSWRGKRYRLGAGTLLYPERD